MGFEVVTGNPGSRVLLHVPHGATHIPEAVRRTIRLTDTGLAAELARITDAHTDLIAELAAADAEVMPWRFVNRLSRLVVDPERFPDEREEMRAVGMGAVYTRTTHGEVLRDDHPELLDGYFHPYADAMTSTVDERLAATGHLTIVDVHSYPAVALPYELHKDGERPEVCLGTDPFHTPPGLLTQAQHAFRETRENTPFSGCYVPLKHYGREPRVRAIMIEIRRDNDPAEMAEALANLVNRIERDR